MSDIKIERFSLQFDLLFNGSIVDTLYNLDELLFVQCQIAEKQLTNYQIKLGAHLIDIDKLGQLSRWPEEFAQTQKLFVRLHNARRSQIEHRSSTN